MQPSINSQKKQDFRQYCKDQIKKKNLSFDKSYGMLKALRDLLFMLRARRILFYLPLKHEVKVQRLFAALKRVHVKRPDFKIFVPRVRGVSFDSVEFRYGLRKNAYQILEPTTQVKNTSLDVMVVPVLGMDSSFRRIGFGKGMYDRFFARLKNKKPKIIFIAKNLYFSQSIITQDHDIQGDYLLCETQILKRGKNDRIYYYQRSDKRGCVRRYSPFYRKEYLSFKRQCHHPAGKSQGEGD